MALIDDNGNRVRIQPTPTPTPAAPPPTGNTAQNKPTGYSSQSTFTAQSYVPAGDGGSTTTAPTTKQPLNAGQMQAADRDYDKWKNSGAPTTRVFIELMQKHKNEPDYLSELVNRAKEKSPGVLDYMMGGLNGAFMRDSGGGYASGFSDGDRQTIVDTLNVARSKGYLTDQEVRDHAAHSPGWQDVANRMGISGAGVDPTTDGATSALEKAQGEYDDAHKGVAELDEQLQKELAKFGGALDDKQRAAYVAKFKDLHKAEYGKEAQKAEALAKVLEDNRPALERAAISDPQARGKLYTALEDVASSESPKAALEYSADLARPENGDLRAAFADHPDFEKEITQPAMSGTPAQLMAENGGDAKSAFAQLKEMAQPLIDVGQNYGKPGYELFKTAPGDVKEAWEAISEASEGKFNGLEKLAEDWKDKSVGGLAKGIASAGLSIGLGLYRGVSDVQKGDLTDAINAFAGAGQTGLEVAAGATKALADAGKLAQYTEKALKFADFASKLAPGLGLIANGTSFVEHIQEAGKNGGNIGFAVSALGDAIGVMGSAIELIPGGEGPGALFDGIGAGVSALGELIGNAINEGKLKDEEKQGLKAAGFSDSMVDTLMKVNGDRLKELTGDLKLTPAQIQHLAEKYPSLIDEGDHTGYSVDALKGIQKAWNLDPSQLTDLLDAIGQGSSDPNYTLFVLSQNLSRDTGGEASSQDRYRTLLQKYAGDSSGGKDFTVGFQNALAWLDQHKTPNA